MNRNNLIKLALFSGVVVLLGVFIAGREGSGDRIAEGLQPVFPELKAELEQLQALSIRKQTGELLVRAERSGDEWRIMNRDGYPADRKRIRDLLTALAEAKLQEAKTTNPEWYQRLGVQDVPTTFDASAAKPEKEADPHDFSAKEKDGPRLVSVTLGDGSEKALIVGERAEGWKAHYARVPGDVQSWVLDREVRISMDTLAWMDVRVIDVDLDRIQAVTHRAPDGETLQISKQKPGQEHFDVADIPEGRELRYPAIPEVVADVIDNLRMEDVRALGKFVFPAGSIYESEFTTFDGLRIHAKAAKVDEDHFVALTASFDERIRYAAADAGEGADGASEPAVDTGSEAEDQATREAPESPVSSLKPVADVKAEVKAMQKHLGSWVFQIAEYRYRGFTKRLGELLKVDAPKPETGAAASAPAGGTS